MGPASFIYSDNLGILIGKFRPFPLNVIINLIRCAFIILLFISCSFYLFFVSFLSLVGLIALFKIISSFLFCCLISGNSLFCICSSGLMVYSTHFHLSHSSFKWNYKTSLRVKATYNIYFLFSPPILCAIVVTYLHFIHIINLTLPYYFYLESQLSIKTFK